MPALIWDLGDVPMCRVPCHINVPVAADSVTAPLEIDLEGWLHNENNWPVREDGRIYVSDLVAQGLVELDEHKLPILPSKKLTPEEIDGILLINRPNEIVKDRVVVAAYWIDQYLVTNEFFEKTMGWVPQESKANGPKAPVTHVSWYDCVLFCNVRSEKLGMAKVFRLDGKDTWSRGYEPTDIEIKEDVKGIHLQTRATWFVAAMGGTNSDFYGPRDDIGWHLDNTPGDPKRPQPVGLKLPNLYGLYDMQGNVWEWMQDPAEGN